MIVYK